MSKNSGSSSKVEFWTAAVELFQESQLSCTEFCGRENRKGSQVDGVSRIEKGTTV